MKDLEVDEIYYIRHCLHKYSIRPLFSYSLVFYTGFKEYSIKCVMGVEM